MWAIVITFHPSSQHFTPTEQVKKSEIPKRACTTDKSISTGIKYWVCCIKKPCLISWIQFVHNSFWLKLKWNARWKLFYCIIYRSSIWSSRTLTKLKSQSQKRFNERKYQYLKYKIKNHSGTNTWKLSDINLAPNLILSFVQNTIEDLI
jgi:hypothetical protein